MRNRCEYGLAIEAFKSAELAGVNSLALNRDFAECLFRDGQEREALKRIETARKRDPANIFILDLYIRIHLANNSITEAERALDEKERYDVDRKFYTIASRGFLQQKNSSEPPFPRRKLPSRAGMMYLKPTRKKSICSSSWNAMRKQRTNLT
jgi:predicted Zn-dependent protease